MSPKPPLRFFLSSFGGLNLPLPWKRWFPPYANTNEWIFTVLGHLSETLESLSPSKRTDLENYVTRRIFSLCLGAIFSLLATRFASPFSSSSSSSPSSLFFMSLVSLTLSLTSNTNRRERERKVCVSFDDDDLLIYVVLHETITVFYAYTRRRGIDALLSRRCVVTRGFSHSR